MVRTFCVCTIPFNFLFSAFRGEIVRYLVYEHLELEYMMSWFSTLGGAFSALGDYFNRSADIAGRISMQQLKLAFRLGDPNIVSRCLLYLSISLIQKHNFKASKLIIRRQYRYAIATNDTRLMKMSLGIWSKLQWTHKTTRLSSALSDQ